MDRRGSGRLADGISLRDRWWLVLWIVPAFVLVRIALHLVAVEYPVGHDAETHTFLTMRFAHILQTDPSGLVPDFRQGWYHKWPPLFYLLASLFYLAAPGPLALQAALIVTAGLFVVATAWAAWLLTRDGRLTLAAVVVLLGNPGVLEALMSYNLEPIQLAAVAAFSAIVFAEPFAAGRPVRALFAGLGAGALLLSKSVILVPLAVPIALYVVLVVYRRFRDPRRAVRRTAYSPILFLAAIAAVALAWYAPRLRGMLGFMVWDAGELFMKPLPWWFYLDLAVKGFAAAPLLIALIAAPFFRREGGWTIKLFFPLTGGMFAALFFSAMGTKHPWYILPSYLLFVLFCAGVLAGTKAPFRRAASSALLVVYGLIAVLNWFPRAAIVADALALGSARPIIFRQRIPDEPREAARAILDHTPPADGPLKIVATSAVPTFELAICLLIDRPALAAGRWFYSGWIVRAENDAHSLDGVRFLVAFETGPATGGLDVANLAPYPDFRGDWGTAVIDRLLIAAADQFVPAARVPLTSGRTLAIFRRVREGPAAQAARRGS